MTFYGGEYEDGNHEGVWKQVEKQSGQTEEEQTQEEQVKTVVEVPVFGDTDLGKRKVLDHEVIDLTSDSDDELSQGALPDVANYALDLPQTKKRKKPFDRDVNVMFRCITGSKY